MSEGDTPRDAGPQSVEERIDAVLSAPGAQPDTPDDDAENAAAAEAAEAEGDKPEAEDETGTTEAPEEADADGPQVLTLEDYGDVVLEVDGQRITLRDLHKGTLRQSDYTRKTQELANERKALEAQKAEIAEMERRAKQALLNAGDDEPEPDWDKLFEEDPLEAPRLRYQWEKKQAQKAQARREAAQQMELARQKFRHETAQKALELMPEWSEVSAYATNEPARKQAALKAGFTEAEYGSAVDMRMAVLLEWAAKGLAKADASAAVEKKVSRPPAVLKPGSVRSKAQQEADAKLAMRNKLAKPMSAEERVNLFFKE